MIEYIKNNIEYASLWVSFMTFFSSILLGSITIYFAKKNDQILAEMKRDREDEMIPILKVPRARLYESNSSVDIYYKNIGKGLAHNIRISLPSISYEKNLGMHGGSLSLEPNEDEVYTELSLTPESFSELLDSEKKIIFDYKDIYGNSFESAIDMDFYDDDRTSRLFVVKNWQFSRKN